MIDLDAANHVAAVVDYEAKLLELNKHAHATAVRLNDYIATDWELHLDGAVRAARRWKEALVEVEAARVGLGLTDGEVAS
ncbi:hypothetical protein [Arthrobacter sp. A2-55]|uniref:hypothetical protein n=1 Tax=Arthrobacter sp. A2-55 TaxID=2897337 RepID=UPI0021CD318B|nr:hypothetical protein [Arthrobacter sp. A2-55]MCU6481921.1 hypothetical protein [Arthrobacter sp. A2-55]